MGLLSGLKDKLLSKHDNSGVESKYDITDKGQRRISGSQDHTPTDVVLMLLANNGPMSARQIAPRIGFSSSDCHDLLGMMHDEGLVEAA